MENGAVSSVFIPLLKGKNGFCLKTRDIPTKLSIIQEHFSIKTTYILTLTSFFFHSNRSEYRKTAILRSDNIAVLFVLRDHYEML